MKSALLIIDVQQTLCAGKYAAFDIDRVVDRINALAVKARAAGAPVIFVQHEEDEGLRYGSAGWQLYERLVPGPEDLRVRKTASDAFHRTGLEDILRSRDVGRLVVCGLQSELCVDSTVRRSLALGYPVVLVSDAHSTMDNGLLSAAQISAHHNVTLASVGGYGPVVTVAAADEISLGDS